ncbi:hypothetical protein FE257_000673 [Aspergillus nanangensis]|uniref:C2H2-type domain-containing protein n=1 Tax=Aspergillus nanangensis TaxID=2582783 RepID=A0AAD4GQ46_ASPNN|nr:hypothetical protein FE257_000673 [Aspergillus nanangensis]
MSETNRSPGQRFRCTSRECSQESESINDWRLHVNEYSFVKGHVCVYKRCGEFIPSCANESRAHQYHLYLNHDIKPPRTDDAANIYINKNYSSVGEGMTWCYVCEKLLELHTSVDVLNHFELHIRLGSTLEIPGQTKYPHLFRQVSGERVVRSTGSGTETKDGGIDLSSRGVTVWMSPA